jgi:uncharacterized protein YcbK (DUF882 family)
VPERIARKSRLVAARLPASKSLALAGLFVALGCNSLQSAIADGETRTLSFQHTHRDDSLTITFKRNGRYDQDALKKLNHFLRDWRTDEVTEMAPGLFDILWEITREVDAKQPIHIVSSYRSPKTNAMLRRRSRGVAQFSQHMLGKAIDFFIPGVPLEQLRYAGLRLQRGGVGFYPTSGSPFVHVDVGSVRHWPRMAPDQLARVLRGKPYHHGTVVADAGEAAPGRGRNFLAKFLGIGKDEEDEGESAPRGGTQVASATSTPSRQASVPMPRTRPHRPAEFTLASASSSPAPAPAERVNLRGSENEAPVPQAEREEPVRAPMPTPVRTADAGGPSLEAITPSGERLAWVTGPQGEPPRPPRDIAVAATAETVDQTTTSLSSWTSNPNHNDRVPPEVALAYAAASQSEPEAVAPAVAAPPMGALRANPANTGNATVATRKPATNSPAAKIAPRGNDPWLRGIVMTPSVHYALSVNLMGAPDYRTLRPLIHKPRTTVAMIFSNDPGLGLTSVKFSGPAVSFLPTITYQTRTAGLH